MNHSFHHHSSPFDHHQSLSSHVHPTSWICQGPSHQLVDLGRCLGMVWSESPCSSSMETGGPLPVPRPATRNRRESNGGERGEHVSLKLPSLISWTEESHPEASVGTAPQQQSRSIKLLLCPIYIYYIYIYACDCVCVCITPWKNTCHIHMHIYILYIYIWIYNNINIMYINK